MQTVTQGMQRATRRHCASRKRVRWLKRQAHHRIRTHLRMLLVQQDWETVLLPTCGVRALTERDVT
jgi:hypothetical protein